jgi:hypothetical protein
MQSPRTTAAAAAIAPHMSFTTLLCTRKQLELGYSNQERRELAEWVALSLCSTCLHVVPLVSFYYVVHDMPIGRSIRP